jgi:hypothetical protein
VISANRRPRLAIGSPTDPQPGDGVLFKNRIDGLPTDLVQQSKVVSGDNPADYFLDTFSTSGTATESADYAMMYSSDDPINDTLSATTKDRLRQTYQWNVVHNPDAKATLTTAGGDILTRSIHRNKAAIAVDANQDGGIDFTDPVKFEADRTTSSHPYKFWINDDHDYYDAQHDDYDDAATGDPDYLNGTIDNRRDLEDFTRLQLHAPDAYSPADDSHWSVTLQFMPVSGAPSINVYKADAPGAVYLTDNSVASAYMGRSKLYTVSGTEVNLLLTGFDNAAKTASYLFEGRTAGEGPLVVRFYHDGVLASEDRMFIRLQSIDKMYETYDVADGAIRNSTGDLKASQIPKTYNLVNNYSPYSVSTGEREDYVLFVHGWRMQPADKEAFAATSFKRLFWQGYKGRFGVFDWPTEWISTDGLGPWPTQWWADLRIADISANFARSEEKAWNSAPALRALLAHLSQVYQNQDGTSRVRLFAHSMGGFAASEALRLEALVPRPKKFVNTYVATQTAVWSEAYNGSSTARRDFADPNIDNYYWLNARSGPYFAHIDDVAAKVVNFFNPKDYALENEIDANQIFRPNIEGHSYNGNPGTFFRGGTALNRVADRFEIFAYGSVNASYGVGMTRGVGRPFTSEVDLQALDPNPSSKANFSDAPWDHSAEFLQSNMLRGAYWKKLMEMFYS